MTFALNRLANLQEQLGREITQLPETIKTSETDQSPAKNTKKTSKEKTSLKDISIILDGKNISFGDQKAIEENAHVLVPIYAICNELGATASWNKDSKKVTITKGDTTIVLTIGSSIASVNGKEVEMTAAPKMIKARTVVPINFLAEVLGISVKLDSSSSIATLVSN